MIWKADLLSDVYTSIFSSVEAMVYRCRNDADYSMQFIAGNVGALTGYCTAEIIENAVVSWVGITAPEDVKRVFSEVDAAIEQGASWDTAYRILHKDGHRTWVRERGSAVYENGKLKYLQGLVVSAEAEMALRRDLETLVMKTKSANSDIVDLSRQITRSVGQLTLLSVNARIEAARSGTAGAGFAVVANEIKSLADKNGNLAQQITQKLS